MSFRRKELTQMADLVRRLRREIRFSALPLNRILFDCREDHPLILAMDCSEPFDLDQSYRLASDAVRKESFLNRGDWAILDRLFRSLGRGDLSEQEACLALCEEELSRRESEARDSFGKRAKPALVLSSSAGAILWLLTL